MKIQKITKTALLAAAAGMMYLPAANATLSNITTPSLPDLTTLSGHGTPTASESLVEKGSGLTPAPDSEWAWMTSLGLVTGSSTFQVGGTSASPDLSAFVGDYLVVHWGNGEAGKFFDPNPKGGFFAIYLIQSASGNNIGVPTFSGDYANGKSIKTCTLDIGGLSGWNVFTNDLSAGGHSVVPEPSTIVAGALLLLPFGVSTLRVLRKSRQA
jgi:hypothetical protein